MEASSTTSRSTPVSGSSASRAKPSPGTHSSSRWIVVASAPGRLGQPPRRLAGRRAQAHRALLVAQQVDQRAHRRGLAGARQPPVRIDSRCSAAACDRRPLRRGRRDGRPAGGSAGTSTSQRRRRAGELAHALGEPPLGAVHPRIQRRARRRDELRRRRAAVDARRPAAPAAAPRARSSSSRGRKQWPSCSAARSAWRSAASMRVGRVGGDAERAGHRVGGREADPVDARPARRDPAAAAPSAPPPSALCTRAATAPGTPCSASSSAQRAAAARCSLPGRDRRLSLALADARHLEQARARVAIDDLEHLVAVAVQQPLGAARADVLDRAQQREQRVRGRRRRPAGSTCELAPEARMLAPGARDLDRVALVQCAIGPVSDDLLAVVVERREHREAAVVGAPAHRDDLGGEGAVPDPRRTRHRSVDGRRRHGAPASPTRRWPLSILGQCRTWPGWEPSSPRSSRRSTTT